MNAAEILRKDDIYALFPQIKDRYELHGNSAVGESSGFGAVWKAHDRWLNRDVAIKISNSDLSGEIGLCRDIDGETVRIFDYYQSSDNSDYQAYAMELLDAPWETLSSYIKNRKYKSNDLQHYFDSPDYVPTSATLSKVFLEQGFALMTATASLGSIATRSLRRLNRYCTSAR